MSRRPTLGILLLGLLTLSTCGKDSSTGPANVTPPRLALQTITYYLSHPVYMTSPPGDTHRLFVVEKGGTIRVIKDGTTLGTPFLDVSGLVSAGDEDGLLCLAFAPDYARTGAFYISYTDPSNATVVARYHVSGNADVANPAGEVVLAAPHPEPSHNGGQIAFGPDDMLYVGIGDGHGVTGGDPTGTGQDRTDLLGDLLRIDVRGASGYVVPAGNPFQSPDRPEIWCYGLRNPWRFSFDRATGDLYIADVGQDAREEVDVASNITGRGRGDNFGWNITEGTACFDPASGCNTAGITMPVTEYTHPANSCRAIIGGYVYRGRAIAGLAGTYFYADYCSGEVHSFRYTGASAADIGSWPDLNAGTSTMSFGEDANGEIYIMTDDGRLAKIVAAP
ncbi:MAG TPA: PQQ-dependent sugar dehydrogenase [Candidatus Eisenbacteria bacterium]|nr:PQQ-dependent sugar dehydrogenase [Candidatus Eisenbacteria bacterium]